ncbi:MAG: type IV pilin protein [Gammaproteobacteria bacterium]|nr:MAG: type IV pilin protein [Gammaproteobacteria bacterium]
MKKNTGFTLIELMIVIGVIAILVAIAYPNYQAYLVRANRSVGKAELMSVAARQEHYFLNNKAYTGDLTDLGYPADPYFIDREGTALAAAGSSAIYQVSIAASDAISFTLALTRVNFQLKDTECGNLGLNDTGIRTPATPALCWNK